MEQKLTDSIPLSLFMNGICPPCGGEDGMEITNTFDEGNIKIITVYCADCEHSFELVYRLQAFNRLS